MRLLFIFSLRLFGCFVGAKFLLKALDLDTKGYLLGVTMLLLANVYWLDYLSRRGRLYGPQTSPAAGGGSPPSPGPAPGPPDGPPQG